MPEQVAVIAALEREIRPLVQRWERVAIGALRGWCKDNVVVVCGGIGAGPARQAAETLVAAFHPRLLISAGFAGSLDSSLRVPSLLLPARIVDAGSGHEFANGEAAARYTLLTLDGIAGARSKADLAASFHAHAVDMEAAAVAEVAQKHGLQFRAVKAISEEADFPMPGLQPFVSKTGKFRTARFMAHVAQRPSLWNSVWRLKHTSAQAAETLCRALATFESGNLATQGPDAAGKLAGLIH
jgi:adenosylhomocysteine nucleosidase